MKKVYIVTIENPITEEVKVRAVFARKESAMRAFKDLEKVFTDRKDPLGLSLSVDVCRPNEDEEYVPYRTLITVGL